MAASNELQAPPLNAWWDWLSQTRDIDLSQKIVLVIDDESALRELIAATVTDRVGCNALTAATGEDALEIVKDCVPDVVFSDMRMPGIHGLDLIRAVKRSVPSSDIIVITGYSEAFPYVDVVDAGACDVISKPCSTWEIEGKLMRVFRERHTRERLLLAEEKYRSLFEMSIGSNILLDADSHVVLDANKSFIEFVELDRTNVVGRPFIDLIQPRERDRMKMLFEILAKRGRGTVGDIGFSTNDQTERAADASLTYIDLPGDRFILMNLIDITERRNIEKQLAAAATTDQLTKLSNRRAFDTRLRGAVIRARREEQPLCLVCIDLDNFKQCNDAHGHQIGDRVLGRVADVIRKSIRDGRSDEGFRLGGDEFAVILNGATVDAARTVAERMRAAFEQAQTYGTTLSIGIAGMVDGMDADRIMKSADNALYEAKGRGKNAICTA